jgi:hypothetical protein
MKEILRERRKTDGRQRERETDRAGDKGETDKVGDRDEKRVKDRETLVTVRERE